MDILEIKQRQTEHLEEMLRLMKEERDQYVKLYRDMKWNFQSFRQDVADMLGVPTSDDCKYLKVALSELAKQKSASRELLEKAHGLGEQHGGRQLEEDVDKLISSEEYKRLNDRYWAEWEPPVESVTLLNVDFKPDHKAWSEASKTTVAQCHLYGGVNVNSRGEMFSLRCVLQDGHDGKCNFADPEGAD